MSDHSTIEWTDATWQPITGCSVTSPGCKNCYAMKLAGTRLKHHPSRVGLTQDTSNGPVWTGEVRFNEQWLQQPLAWRKPRKIFVCAHGDLFHPAVPDEWIDRVFAVMALAKHHTFQVLTKQASRMRAYLTAPHREIVIGVQVSRLDLLRKGDPVSEWSGLPLPNVRGGISAEDQSRANERVGELLATPLAVRWVSIEPMLGPIDLTRIEARVGRGLDVFSALEFDGEPDEDVEFGTATLDWVVCGGESGDKARPMHPDWPRSLRDQCARAGVPFFFKQWGEWLPAEIDCTESVADDGSDRCLTGRGWAVHTFDDRQQMARIGKKAAGRLLDGVEHNGYPRVTA